MMEERKAYEDRFAAQLKEWKVQLVQLKAKAEKATAELKIKYYCIIDDLQNKYDTARAKLTELKAAGDEKWNDTKTGAENAWDDVRIAFHVTAFK